MRITNVVAKPLSLRIIEPLKIAFASYSTVENVAVKVYTDEDIVGIGESCPIPEITGETKGTVLNIIENFLAPAIINVDPLDTERVKERMNKAVRGHTSAKAALDMAVYDIIGKALRIPIHDFIGGSYRETIDVGKSLSIKDPKQMARDALKVVDQGFKIIKVKIGKDPSVDIERVKAVREAVGDGIILRVDINQAYSPKKALWVIGRIEKYEPELVEQPVQAYDLDGLAEVTASTRIPIMADESVHSPRDALEVVKRKAADIINIKLMKSSGISNALRIASIAEAADIPCYMGCMLETGIATAAGVHVAAAVKNIRYAELVGPVWLLEDPTTGVEIDNGKIRVPEEPGLGVKIIEKSVNNHR